MKKIKTQRKKHIIFRITTKKLEIAKKWCQQKYIITPIHVNLSKICGNVFCFKTFLLFLQNHDCIL